MLHIALLPSGDLSYESGSVIYALSEIEEALGCGHCISVIVQKLPERNFPKSKRLSFIARASLLEHPVITDRPIPDDVFEHCQREIKGALREVHSRRPVDVIHCHYLSYPCLAASEFAQEIGVPVVASSFGRDLFVGATEDEKLRDFALQSVARVDLVTYPTRAVAEGLKALIASPALDQRFFESEMPVDLDFIGEVTGRTRDKQKGSELCISTINSCFKPEKGIETILKACSFLADKGVSFKLFIAGADDHPDQTNLKRLVGLSELYNLTDNVTFTGYLDRAEIAKLLWKSDIFVDARTTSSFSSVLAEALSAGTPIVCSDSEASRIFVSHDANGILFDAGVAEDLERQINRLIKSKELREKLSRNASISSLEYQTRYHPKSVFSELFKQMERIRR